MILKLNCFTKIISEIGFTHVHAYEVSVDAINNLKNLKLNVLAATADLFKPREVRRVARENALAKILVLDPPREGFALIDDLVRSLVNLKEVYYISCDAVSFARDCKKLQDLGWNLAEIQPLDQFPNTPHVEVLSCFKKI